MINVSQNQWTNKEETASPTFSSIHSDLDLLLIPYGKTLNLVTTDQSNTHQIDIYFSTPSFNYISFTSSLSTTSSTTSSTDSVSAPASAATTLPVVDDDSFDLDDEVTAWYLVRG